MAADSRPSSSEFRIAVLVSGSGTTLLNLLKRIEQQELTAEIPLVVASRDCLGAERALQRGLPTWVLKRTDYASSVAYSNDLFHRLREERIDLVVLAGFLSRIMIPEDFQHRVMNIHPALIPSFAGRGMYGQRVHEAVVSRGCKVSGCTVHFCDNEYDNGPIILQGAVPVQDEDDAHTLGARVFALECELYPQAIRLFQQQRLRVESGRVRVLPAADQ
ncbi:phosphoribosylglycinamide formyltransferase [Planctomicrobium sp. SH664]|uniref:phosphoribosylglycinamide formyltransferase n=1 Tax=Planctomicrobium sp. SH664 TaxID=3448125 RepID=UPI003F5C7629